MMKNQIRRLTAVIMAFLLLFSAAGCGVFGNGTADGSSADNDKSGSNTDGNDVAAAALTLPQENPRSGCGAKRYRMDLKLDPDAHELSGSVVTDVINRTDETLDALCFRFFAAAITADSVISKAENADTDEEYVCRSEKDGSVVYLDLGDDALAPGKTLSVRLTFFVRIPKADDRFGYHQSKDGTLFNLTFCFPQLSFLRDGVWDTDPYYDMGETTFNELSDYEVTFEAPESYRVLSSGTATTKNGITVITAPDVREMAITACDFAEIIEKKVDGVQYHLLAPTYRFSDEAYRTQMYDLLLQTAVSAVSYFNGTIGPYCYDELDIIPAPLQSSGGMEMPGLIYVGVAADADNGELWNDDVAYVYDTVAHEVAHEWFYCAVGNDQYDEAWLDEAFAMYCASEYVKNGTDVKEKMEAMAKTYNGTSNAAKTYWKEVYDGTPSDTVYINLSCGDYVNEETYTEAVYSRGYVFLRTLSEIMGEDSFHEMLREWYDENNGKIVRGGLFVKKVLDYKENKKIKKCLNAYLSSDRL